MILNCGQKAGISKMKKSGHSEERIAEKTGIPLKVVKDFLVELAHKEARKNWAAPRRIARRDDGYRWGAHGPEPKVTLPRVRFLENGDV